MPANIVRFFGFAGTGLIILAIFIPILFYRGKLAERFSLLNHFISELGEVGVSQAAWVFNAGLFIGGLVLLPYIISLGITFGSLLGWLGTAAGIVAVLGVAAVGILPMNNLNPHIIAAMTYFRAGLVMVLFFGLAIQFQPRANIPIPKSANFLSLVTFLAYGAFLTVPMFRKEPQDPNEVLDPQAIPERPCISLMAILEWLVFFSTVAWMAGMIFFI
jgi:hypothetical membrane protein